MHSREAASDSVGKKKSEARSCDNFEVSMGIIGVIEAISMIYRLNSRNPEPARTTCHNFWLTSVRSRGAEFVFVVHSIHDCVVRIAASVRTQLLFCRSLSDCSIGGHVRFFCFRVGG